jgi:hypothetical protein
VFTVYVLIDMHNETEGRKEEAMEETHHQQTDSGTQYGQPTMQLRVSTVPTGKPGALGDPGGFDATESELLHLLQSLIPLTGENLDQWTWEERRDYLNWCVDEGVLTIQDGRLVPVEELVPTAPLTHDTDVDAHDCEEHAALLRTVERTKPVIDTKPAISTKEWADDLGLNIVVYSYTPNMSINAH